MIKNIFLTAILAVSLFSSEFKVDKDYSDIRFEVSKLLFISIEGEFSEFRGTISIDENNNISKIDGVVEIDSINTQDQDRDEHLKADDYFNILSFPNIVFKSEEITNNTVKAKVSIKGIKKELTFKISDLLISKNSVGLKLSSVIDRQEFLLNGSKSALFADEIEVTAKLLAVKIK